MRSIAIAAAVMAAGLIFGPPANSQDATSYSCRASAARVAAPGDVVSEPVRANAPLTPCLAQSASVLEQTTVGPVTAQAVGAFTAQGEGGRGGTGFASAARPSVALPGLTVSAEVIEATAKTECAGTTATNSGTSRVVGLTINGNTITVPNGDAPLNIPLGPLGQISLNHEIVEGTSLTRRAIWIDTPAVEVVLAEAVTAFGANACKESTGPGGGGVPPVCPPGSTYDASRNVCVVREGGGAAGGGGSGGGTVTGAPFQGPSGGRVVTLAEARRRYKSLCLRGSGPRYAIIGTNRNDNITGTNGKDRILLLAGRDRAEGGRGNDCIDGGSGVDTMSGALGSDRLIGKSGGDHLIGGSHADLLSSGSGNDTINSGFGKDRISAGSGGDKINIATAGPAVRSVKCGSGRDKLRLNRNELRRARRGGCERIYVIR